MKSFSSPDTGDEIIGRWRVVFYGLYSSSSPYCCVFQDLKLFSDFYLIGALLMVAMAWLQMIDDTELGFVVNFLGICIFVLVVAYHYVVADPKYEAH
jgi:hypothetical protein